MKFSQTIHTCVTLGDPRHSVDNRLTIVDTDVLLLLESGVAPLLPVFSPAEAAALANLSNNSLLSPCSAKGAGSTPRRVKRSARDAKHRRAPSDTWQDIANHVNPVVYQVHSSPG